MARKPIDPNRETEALQETGYDAAFEGLAGSVDRQVSQLLQEVDGAAALLLEVLGTPEPDRRVLLENGVRFHSLQLCKLLEARSREAGFEDPARAVRLAELAVLAAERLDETHYGTALVEDARASAWAYLGNALRIASDHRQAEEALQSAREHNNQGGDAYTEALILSFEASLRNAQGKYDSAAKLLDDAIAIYRDARDAHQEGTALIKKGIARGYASRPEEAIRLIRRGLRKIDLVREPRLLVAARHNLTLFLTESGHHQQALKSIAETRRLYLDLGERMNLIRLRWLEGKVARELGDPEASEAALREAMEAFLADHVGIDAALVALDLAIIHTQRNETGALKELAAELIPIFEWGELHEGALAALLLFRQAAEAEEVTPALLQQVTAGLRPAQDNLDLRFRTGS